MVHLKVGIQIELLVFRGNTDTRLGVFTDALLEKVGLALKRNHFHESKRVSGGVAIADVL
jgi:hypothetical protein